MSESTPVDSGRTSGEDRIAELAALIPEELVAALLRAAQLEAGATDGDEVLFSPADVAAIEQEAEEAIRTGEAEDPREISEARGLLAHLRQIAGKTARELDSDSPDDLVTEDVQVIRRILVTSWIEMLHQCAEANHGDALLDADLLPRARTDFLIEHGWENWYDVLAAQLNTMVPPEIPRWLHRVLVDRLLPLIEGACDAKDPEHRYVILDFDDADLCIERTDDAHRSFRAVLRHRRA